MKETNRERKNEIKYLITLNEEQKEAKRLIIENQIVIITGRAGSGKSISGAITALDFLNKKMCDKILVTRSAIEVGKSLGYLPGAQPYDSKILTPNGWITMGEIKKGDIVYAFDGSEVEVLDTYEHGERDVYEITTTKNKKAKTCDKHIWEVQESNYKRKYNNPKIVDTLYIKNNLYNDYGKLRFSLPKNSAISFYKKELPLHPYVLGCLLGDGSIGSCICICNKDQELLDRFADLIKPLDCFLTKPKKENQIAYTIKSSSENNKPGKSLKITNILTGEEKLYDRIGRALKEININIYTLHHRCNKNRTINNYKYEFIQNASFSTNPVKNILNDLGLSSSKSFNKFIPDIYKIGSFQQRLELLQGLLDTDGNIKKNGEVNFTTTSEKLRDDIIEIVNSLGGSATYSTRNRIGKTTKRDDGRDIIIKRLSYQIVISFSKYPEIFYISRKKNRLNEYSNMHRDFIKSVEKIGFEKVKCIKINHPRQLYITDNYIVTHNTLDEKFNPYMEALIENLYKCWDKSKVDELVSKKLIDALPVQFIRGKTIDDILIVEEAQNLNKQEMLAILTRLGKTGKIVINGDNEQQDTKDGLTGLSYVIELSKKIPEIQWIKLKENHRSDLVGKILNIEYGK